MRDLIFRLGTENVAVQIHNKQVLFCKLQGGIPKYSPIDGLQLNVAGILKEFPDLKDKEEKEIKKIAIERFKEHIKSLPSEDEIQEYVTNDLKKHGYKLTHIRKPGHRQRRVK